MFNVEAGAGREERVDEGAVEVEFPVALGAEGGPVVLAGGLADVGEDAWALGWPSPLAFDRHS